MHTNQIRRTALARVTGRETGGSSGKSMLFVQGDRSEWIGWSQISHVTRRRLDPANHNSPMQVEITIPAWLAEKCGFEYEEI